MPRIKRKDIHWNNDALQFARLLDEIQASGAITPEVMNFLSESMDLDWAGIDEIFDRAQQLFDESKAVLAESD